MTRAFRRWALLAFTLATAGVARAEPVATAVLPFSEAGPDARGLGPAFADMLTTDLGVTAELRLLERKNLAAVLGELELQRGGLVDPSTASRMGGCGIQSFSSAKAISSPTVRPMNWPSGS